MPKSTQIIHWFACIVSQRSRKQGLESNTQPVTHKLRFFFFLFFFLRTEVLSDLHVKEGDGRIFFSDWAPFPKDLY